MNANTGKVPKAYNKLNALTTVDVQFMAMLVRMSSDFQKQILKGYKEDDWWKWVNKQIDENDELGKDAMKMLFVWKRNLSMTKADPYFGPKLKEKTNPELETVSESKANEIKIKKNNKLIFHFDCVTSVQQLCISLKAAAEVIAIVHGDGHPGFNKCYKTIIKLWYMRRLVKQLQSYIKHCPQCLVLQTSQHQPYGLLQPIYSPAVPYHTIMLDFILVLPTSDKGYNTILLLTDKYTKKVSLPPGKATYLIADWAQVLIDRLDLVNWGIPKAIISDRDLKFLSDLWKAIHAALSVKLLYSTAYHPQTNRSSECTNQTAEIALQFYLHTMNQPEDWPKVLLRIQLLINNIKSVATTRTPNKVALGFTPNRLLDLLFGSIGLSHKVAQIKAKDAISFT